MKNAQNYIRVGLVGVGMSLFPVLSLFGQALEPEITPKPSPRIVRPAPAQPPGPISPGVARRPIPTAVRSDSVRTPAQPPSAYPATPANALAWDKELKELIAEPGDTNVLVTFQFTNQHTSEVVIKNVRPSCGCTTLELPPMPWTIPAGTNGEITASLDLRGKRGTLTKSITVDSTSGYKSLLFKVTVPTEIATATASGETVDPERLKNMQMAQVDRQVVFKNADCAKCHAEPAHGKMGEDLYRAACAICHDTPHRATMVPDLTQPKFPTSAPYWKYWIINGRPGSLMPAFSKIHGGPLTDEQIESLVEFLTETITKKTQTSARKAGPAATETR